MNLQVDFERMLLAHKALRAELWAERNSTGFWDGHLASSPLATATAISALVAAHQPDTAVGLREHRETNGQVLEHLLQTDLSEFLVESVHWLAQNQNDDGGWGDCVGAKSCIAATLLVQAAFRLTGVPAKYTGLLVRADQFVDENGGFDALRELFDDDKTLLAAILANCALAGMIDWRQVPTVPFEYKCVPEKWELGMRSSASPYAKILLLAVGLAKHTHRPTRNPVTRILRRSLRTQAVSVLQELQATDDSYLAFTPITAFVVMSLATSGYRSHAVVQRGVEYLLSQVRGDASWPISANLATANTTLALECLARSTDGHDALAPDESTSLDASLHRLVESQRNQLSLMGQTVASWAASQSAGAPTTAGDTARVLIALKCASRGTASDLRAEVNATAGHAIEWLLDCQNGDGGWPTFYRDDVPTDSDESSTDVTALALRALAAWHRDESTTPNNVDLIAAAIERGWQYLALQQRDDGSFIPRWFGNEYQPDDGNPVYGTAQVLMTCADLARLDSESAERAAAWLRSAQHTGGGWGPPRARRDYSAAAKDGFKAWRANEAMSKLCSVEETALAVSALLPTVDFHENSARTVSEGLNWLAAAVEQDVHRTPAIIGFSLGKIWYHERLYPLVFAAGAFARAVRQLAPQPGETAPVG